MGGQTGSPRSGLGSSCDRKTVKFVALNRYKINKKIAACVSTAVPCRSLTMLINTTSDEHSHEVLPPSVAEEIAAPSHPEMSAPMEKWGMALDAGFQVLPDLLLRHQRELKLTANDLVVLLHLTMAWWVRDRHPFPRTSTIARRMDASDRTIQRSIDHLRKLKLIYKTTRKDAAGENRPTYDLSPLAAKLKEIALTDPLSQRRRLLRAGETGIQPLSPAQAQ
jgi:predicted transcriptional regulator